MTDRRKKLLRWVGYPLLAWVTFIFAMHFTFPYDSLRGRLVELLAKEYDVGIAEVSPGFLPGRVRIKGITLTTHPTVDGEKPKTLVVDRIDLGIGWLALLGKSVSVDFDARLGEGRIVGNFRTSETATSVEARTEGLALEAIPGIGVATGGAPIKGPVEAKVKLALPQGKWAAASGAIELSCDDCSIGDGVTKVRPMAPGQANAFSSEGFTLPHIKLGKVAARMEIKQGAACIVELTSKSNDGELSVDGGLKFADPFRDTQASLYARVKLSDEFKKASARNQDFEIFMSTGARQPDGWSTFQAHGPFMGLRWLAARVPPPPMKECSGVAAPPAAPVPRVATPSRPAPVVPATAPPPPVTPPVAPPAGIGRSTPPPAPAPAPPTPTPPAAAEAQPPSPSPPPPEVGSQPIQPAEAVPPPTPAPEPPIPAQTLEPQPTPPTPVPEPQAEPIAPQPENAPPPLQQQPQPQ